MKIKLSELEIFSIKKNHRKDKTLFIIELKDKYLEINYYKNVSEYAVSNFLITSNNMIKLISSHFLFQKGYGIKEIKHFNYSNLPNIVKHLIRENIYE